MKYIYLSVKEFLTFKEIAKFFYDYSYSNGIVVINADSALLEELGY